MIAKMAETSLEFITCLQLREEYTKCRDDINKRVLVIDVRNKALYERSHLCLDARNCTTSVSTKTRVMNIDPDRMRVTTVQNIKELLDEHDLRVFKKRRDATDVILIDRNTDDIDSIRDPKSKIMRLIVALDRFDTSEEKIIVPIKILKGGYKQWLAMYPHWTTDPNFDPDILPEDLEIRQAVRPPTIQPLNSSLKDYKFPSISTTPIPPSPLQEQSSKLINPPPAPKSIINKVVPPIPTTVPMKIVPSAPPLPQPAPTAAKPNIIKIAPGTAIPVTPVLSLRSPLPRSHSSPNVAQADGDDLEATTSKLDNINLFKYQHNNININNNHLTPVVPSSIIAKPRFDRTLKPAFNSDSVNAIRAQLNFGRSPEASGKAITGLQNLGNTCFMNSVIQCLSYSPKLASYLCSEVYYNHLNFNSQYGTKGELAIEFGSLVEKLNSHHHRYIEPKSFRESIVKHIGFAGNEQQDSHEFMMMLFDKLHHDLNVHAKDKFKQNGIIAANCNSNNDDSNVHIPRATLGYQFWKKHLDQNKSIISDLFEGIFMSTLTCSICKGQSNTFEVFNCLSLPIPSESRCHLKDCLNHFSNPERIEAAWECPRCKQKREADKKIVICKLPQILIIHLKRFSLDGRWRQKLQTTVDFPLTDLTVDCTTVLPQSAYGINPYKSSYNLYAVVNHYGHLDGGHYTAFCKLENQRWYTFDDSNVSEMKDTDVCGQSAYILFYAASG